MLHIINKYSLKEHFFQVKKQKNLMYIGTRWTKLDELEKSGL